uniref:DUF600 domain-containing protein n=2 Tax=unclassified Prevotella TaxID=2638335 RepID=A0AB33JHZ4_9BACT
MNNNFDNDFHSLLTEIVELAFEYVDNNIDEVDAVYAIGLIEEGYFFKTFYKINGQLAKSHKVNDISKKQYDISSTRAFNLLNLGNEILMKIENLFMNCNREIPTILKLVYFPKTGNFESYFGYERNFSHSTTKTAQDIYEEWYRNEGVL